MTAIWHHDGNEWRLVAPSGFPAEQALHDLVEQTPNMLPLSGAPQLVILGREVHLGGNKADLIAVEPSGRLAIIEIKLAKSAEARRAVIAQILTYAAFLRGQSIEALERDILGVHLNKFKASSVSDAISGVDQTSSFQPALFSQELARSLAEGRFRLVLVLDDAPPELVQLVGYLEAVADKLVIDLVTVAAYNIGGNRVMVPQRVEPERVAPSAPATGGPAAGYPTLGPTTRYVAGAEEFEASISSAPVDQRLKLEQILMWARQLEQEGLVTLETTIGNARWVLRPLLKTDKVGLVVIYNANGASIEFYRSVFEKRAPNHIAKVEALIAPTTLGKGTNTRVITDQLLTTLTSAYREAAQGYIAPVPEAP